jgi:hypothetical protein
MHRQIHPFRYVISDVQKQGVLLDDTSRIHPAGALMPHPLRLIDAWMLAAVQIDHFHSTTQASRVRGPNV